MHVHLHQRPVIQPRALQIFILQAVPQRLDQVQLAPRRRAGARYVAGILRNFRLDQHDMNHRFHPRCFLTALLYRNSRKSARRSKWGLTIAFPPRIIQPYARMGTSTPARSFQRTAGRCEAAARGRPNTSRSTIPNAPLRVSRRSPVRRIQRAARVCGRLRGLSAMESRTEVVPRVSRLPDCNREGVFLWAAPRLPSHACPTSKEEYPWLSTFSICSRSAALSRR